MLLGFRGVFTPLRTRWPDSTRCNGNVASLTVRCPGGQTEMNEHFDNRRRVFDCGDDRQSATEVWTVFDVDIEYTFEQADLADAGGNWERAAPPRSSDTLSGLPGMICARKLDMQCERDIIAIRLSL